MSENYTKIHNRLLEQLNSTTELFKKSNSKSFQRWEKAKEFMPGGNTRTVLHYDPFPIAMTSGKGTYLKSLDGDTYTDFLGEYSAGLYGHSNEKINIALKNAIDLGLSLGAPNRWESPLAEEICFRFPSIEKVRFTNSGTEANLMAIGAARAYTGREKIMVFDGGYHGGVLYFKEGHSSVTAPYQFIKVPFNDQEKAITQIKSNSDTLAAVLVEPMLGSGGCIPGKKEFLHSLRKETKKYNICLIFDEVMTSRNSIGGLQKILGIKPDLTTLGKYLGGGVSFGAFGGNSKVMSIWDPTKQNFLAHAGTFNNNTLSMIAGLVGLKEIFTSKKATELFERGERFKLRLNKVITESNANLQVTGVGSILGLHVGTSVISKPPKYSRLELDILKLVHLQMSLRGFLFAQRGFITLNLAMSEKDIDNFVLAFQEVIRLQSDILC